MMYTVVPGNAAEKIDPSTYRIRTASEFQPSQRAMPPHTSSISGEAEKPAHHISIVYNCGKLNSNPPATPRPYSSTDCRTVR